MKATSNGTIKFGDNEIPFLFNDEKDLLTIYFGNKCIEIPEQLNGIVAHESDKMVGGYIYYSLALPLSASDCLLVTGEGAKSVATGIHNAEVEFYIENYQSSTIYNEIRFQFAELDYFIPSKSRVEIKTDQFVLSRIKKNLYTFKIDYCGHKIAVSFDLKAECKTSVNAKASTISEVTIQFPETDDLEYIIGLYLRVRSFFSFVCNRKNIGLRSAIIYGNYISKTIDENKEHVDAYITTKQNIHFSQKYIEPMEGEKKIEKTLNVKYFASKLPELFQLFFEKNSAEDAVVNSNSIHHSLKYRNLNDLEQSLHITAAFEHYVKTLLPEMSSKSTLEFYGDVGKLLEKYIADTTGKKQKKAKKFLKGLTPQIPLEGKILKVCNGYTGWASLSSIASELFNGEEIATLAREANAWRNELAHDKREYVPSIEVIKAIRLVEHLNYAIVLRYAGYNDDETKEILRDLLAR